MSRWQPCCCDKEEAPVYGIVVKHTQNLIPVVPNDYYPGFYNELPTLNYLFYYFKGFLPGTTFAGLTGMPGISRTQVENYLEVKDFGVWSEPILLGQVKDEFIQSGIDTSRSILSPPETLLDDVNVSYTILLPKEWEGVTVQQITPWANVLTPYYSPAADTCYIRDFRDCTLTSDLVTADRYSSYPGGSNIDTNKQIPETDPIVNFFTTFHQFNNQLYLTRDPLGYFITGEMGATPYTNLRNYNLRVVIGYNPTSCEYILSGTCCNSNGDDVNCKIWKNFLVKPKINEKTVVYYSEGISELNKVDGAVVGNIISSVDIKYLNKLLPLLNRFRVWNKWWSKDITSCQNSLVELPESEIVCVANNPEDPGRCFVGAAVNYNYRVIDYNDLNATITGKITNTDFNFTSDPNKLEIYAVKICKTSYINTEGNSENIINILDTKLIPETTSSNFGVIQKNKFKIRDYFFEDTTSQITHILSTTKDLGTVSYPGQVDSCCPNIEGAPIYQKFCAVTETTTTNRISNCDDPPYTISRSLTTSQSIGPTEECSKFDVASYTTENEYCCSYDDRDGGRFKCDECVFGPCFKETFTRSVSAVEVGRSYYTDFGICEDYTLLSACQCTSTNGPCCYCELDPGCSCGTNGCAPGPECAFAGSCSSSFVKDTCGCNCSTDLVFYPSDDIDAALSEKDERIQYPVKFIHTDSPYLTQKTLIITDNTDNNLSIINPVNINSAKFHQNYYKYFNDITKQEPGSTVKLEKYIVSKDFKIFSFIYSKTLISNGQKTFFIATTPLSSPLKLIFNVSETKWRRLNEYSKAVYRCHLGATGCTAYFSLYGCTENEKQRVINKFRNTCTELVKFYGVTFDGRTLDPLGMTGVNFNQSPLPITKINAATDTTNWCISRYF